MQRQAGRLDEAQLRRVVAVQAEVVHRIAVHRIQLHLFPVEESGLRGHRPGRDHMAVGEDEATLGIHDEPGGLR
jgi:hypothetical protein